MQCKRSPLLTLETTKARETSNCNAFWNCLGAYIIISCNIISQIKIRMSADDERWIQPADAAVLTNRGLVSLATDVSLLTSLHTEVSLLTDNACPRRGYRWRQTPFKREKEKFWNDWKIVGSAPKIGRPPWDTAKDVWQKASGNDSLHPWLRT